jgi:hypothetical protein
MSSFIACSRWSRSSALSRTSAPASVGVTPRWSRNRVARAGGPLELAEREMPEPARGEVRVRVVGRLQSLRGSPILRVETVTVPGTAPLPSSGAAACEHDRPDRPARRTVARGLQPRSGTGPAGVSRRPLGGYRHGACRCHGARHNQPQTHPDARGAHRSGLPCAPWPN